MEDGVWAGFQESTAPSSSPPHTHLQLVGAAGTVLLYFHEHALLQLLQEGEEGLELGFQVLLHLGRVRLWRDIVGSEGVGLSKPVLRWGNRPGRGSQARESHGHQQISSYGCPSLPPGGGDFLTSTFNSICLRE